MHIQGEVQVQAMVNVNVNGHGQVNVILKVNGKDKGHAKAVHQAKAKVNKCHVTVNGHVSLRLVYMLRRMLKFMTIFL